MDAPGFKHGLTISLRRHRFDLCSGAVVASVLGDTAGLWRVASAFDQVGGQICIPAMTDLGLGVDLVRSLLGCLQVPLHRFELSVAAHHLISCEVETLLGLSAARDAGLGLALAGVRREHLPRLARLPVSAIILDPELIGCLRTAPAFDAEVAALAIAAQTLGVKVVAPTIETVPQRDRLIELGVTYGEGELLEQQGRSGVACRAPQRATASSYDDRSDRDDHPGADRSTGLRQIHLPQ